MFGRGHGAVALGPVSGGLDRGAQPRMVATCRRGGKPATEQHLLGGAVELHPAQGECHDAGCPDPVQLPHDLGQYPVDGSGYPAEWSWLVDLWPKLASGAHRMLDDPSHRDLDGSMPGAPLLPLIGMAFVFPPHRDDPHRGLVRASLCAVLRTGGFLHPEDGRRCSRDHRCHFLRARYGRGSRDSRLEEVEEGHQ